MAIGEIRRERYTPGMGPKGRTMSWGAVIAGVILAIAIQLMLGLLGLGIGLASLPGSEGSATALASTAGIYSLVAALVGLFVGAYACGRLAGLADRMDAVLHGLVTWAVATLLVVLVLGGTASSVLGGAFGAVGASVSSLTNAAGALGQSASPTASGLPDGVASDLRSLLSPGQGGGGAAADQAGDSADASAGGEAGNGGGVDPGALGARFAEIAGGLSETASPEERDAAIRAIQEAGGLSRSAAEQRLASYQQAVDQMAREARQLADDAARSVSSASFAAFIALLLGAIVAVIGGVLGRAGSTKA